MAPGFRKPGSVDNVVSLDKYRKAPPPQGTGPSHPLAADPPTQALFDLSLDLAQMAFDLAGLVDPTPISDGAGALLALARGQWLDAALSGVSIIPYVGDLAKAGKLPRYLKTVEKAVALAEQSAAAAKRLLPAFDKLNEVLNLLPAGANRHLDALRERITAFLKRHQTVAKEASRLPDVSTHFKFQTYEVNGRIVKEASGRLGVPGKVKSHRKADPRGAKKAQRSVSEGSGDHAGHMIADEFGAPPGKENALGLGTENLSLQNCRMNSGGTWWDLEHYWSEKLQQGYGYEIKVKDWFRKGETRPYKRTVSGTEILPDGTRRPFNREGEVIYGNFSTKESRAATGQQ